MRRLPFSVPPPDPDDLTVALRYVQFTLAVGALAALVAGIMG